MERQVKCRYCNEKEKRGLMYCEEVERKTKVTRKYFHHNCYKKHLKDNEDKKIELEQWDKLFKYIMKLHNLETLDGRMIERLQDLRNGSVNIGKKKVRRYKEGYRYDVILETYKQLSDKIEWSIRNKDFQGRKWNEFSYIFSIVSNNIHDIKTLLDNKERQEILQKERLRSLNRDHDPMSKIKYSPKKDDELDISEFL